MFLKSRTRFHFGIEEKINGFLYLWNEMKLNGDVIYEIKKMCDDDDEKCRIFILNLA